MLKNYRYGVICVEYTALNPQDKIILFFLIYHSYLIRSLFNHHTGKHYFFLNTTLCSLSQDHYLRDYGMLFTLVGLNFK